MRSPPRPVNAPRIPLATPAAPATKITKTGALTRFPFTHDDHRDKIGRDLRSLQGGQEHALPAERPLLGLPIALLAAVVIGVSRLVLGMHSLPEVVAWPVERGLAAYLEWVAQESAPR